MGAAAYNRGTRITARAADVSMPLANVRADRAAHKDEVERLRSRLAEVERDLARARRCIAELRRSKAERMAEAQANAERSDAAIRQLCRIAFPEDARAKESR